MLMIDWNGINGVPKKGYKIIEGEKDVRIEIESSDRRQKKLQRNKGFNI